MISAALSQDTWNGITIKRVRGRRSLPGFLANLLYISGSNEVEDRMGVSVSYTNAETIQGSLRSIYLHRLYCLSTRPASYPEILENPKYRLILPPSFNTQSHSHHANNEGMLDIYPGIGELFLSVSKRQSYTIVFDPASQFLATARERLAPPRRRPPRNSKSSFP